ncbi:hypothetical protein JZO76_01165 [Enterococcus sp. MJM12]|uniref:Flavodoxin-like domain-containing protein n=1 Tax=Candidatus Enterococcus myersii TaxID=2815322 RepID=A0ABS3H3W3_9ENTE|nr:MULTISPECIES: flavodoxin domain-containing protein [Enterococcus]MBO0448136.1 hypothetical protein [Enterococcus sp. MJM12]MCD1024690.1 flavodoxin domain-containing protein [Enterococcus sp. SMC-9]WHA08730.1 flavodoxin domain-containing protein [Enterococcus montenegrensis]
MKTAIVYTTKQGTTKQVATQLAAKIPDAVALPLKGTDFNELKMYQTIIIGSPVTAGMISKEMKTFMTTYQEELKQYRLGLFLCGLQPEKATEVFEQNFPAELLQHATIKTFVGGIYDPKQCPFFSRLIIKKVAGLTNYTNLLKHEKIDELAKIFS